MRQGVQATRRITDNLDEQAFLETFPEDSKPEWPDVQECPQRHRLLLTPFRYSKPHGSRFSTRRERGLFYGSRSRSGCLVEGAYYELVFQAGPERPFPGSSAMRKAWMVCFPGLPFERCSLQLSGSFPKFLQH